jgi:putative membrane protein
VSGAPASLPELLGSWTADPVTIVWCGTAALVYGVGARRVPDWPAARSAAFAAGLLTVLMALCSGVERYSDALLSVHMLQHLLLMLIAPPRLVSGAPIRLALRAGSPRLRRALTRVLRVRVTRALGRPATGVALTAAVVLATHFTGAFELALRHPTAHALEHAAYFGAALLLFAPVIVADPLPHRAGAVGRFGALLGAMVPMAAVGAVLAFDTGVRYGSYLAPAHALHRSALEDQHLAGALMWVGGGIVVSAIGVLVAVRAMVAEERFQRRRDAYLDAGETVVR